MNKKTTFNRHQTGVTLIESLVSLFIFSVGTLGLAALQTTSILQNDDSRQRSVATLKAQELVDRMLSSRTFAANPNALIQQYLTVIGDNAGGIGTFGVDNDNIDCDAPVEENCSENTCDAAQLVAFDINQLFCGANTNLETTTAAKSGGKDGGTVTGADVVVDSSGSFGLSDMDIAMRQNGAFYELYIAWQNRTSNQKNNSVDANRLGGTISSNLCGNIINLDVRVDAICIRFQ